MLTKLFALMALLIALGGTTAGYTQRSAFHLGQERQPSYWPRYGTTLSGRYRNGVWIPSASRTSYGSFRGGGPSAGK